MKSIYMILSSKLVFALACVLFLVCSYWIYRNVKLSDIIGTQTIENISTKTTSPLTLETEDVSKLEIRNGDIVQVLSPDTVKLIVGKSTLEGVLNIISLSYANKAGKMCFIAEMVTPRWMFVGNTDGTALRKVVWLRNVRFLRRGTLFPS